MANVEDYDVPRDDEEEVEDGVEEHEEGAAAEKAAEVPQEIWNFEMEVFQERIVLIEPSEEQQEEIRGRYASLEDETKQEFVERLRDWRQTEQEYRKAQREAQTADHYKGGGLDEYADAETKARPDLTYRQYRQTKIDCQEALQTYYNALARLQVFHNENGKSEHVLKYINDWIFPNLNTERNEMEELESRLMDMSFNWDYESMQERARAFASRDGKLASWVGYWQLGAGSYGRVDLWVKRDATSTIVGRIVVKDSQFKGDEKTWNDEDLWTRGGPDEGVLTEVQAMYSLRGLIGASSVVKIRNYKIDRENKWHRILMEYCPLGDPSKLIVHEYIYRGSKRFTDEANATADNATLSPIPLCGTSADRQALHYPWHLEEVTEKTSKGNPDLGMLATLSNSLGCLGSALKPWCYG